MSTLEGVNGRCGLWQRRDETAHSADLGPLDKMQALYLLMDRHLPARHLR